MEKGSCLLSVARFIESTFISSNEMSSMCVIGTRADRPQPLTHIIQPCIERRTTSWVHQICNVDI